MDSKMKKRLKTVVIGVGVVIVSLGSVIWFQSNRKGVENREREYYSYPVQTSKYYADAQENETETKAPKVTVQVDNQNPYKMHIIATDSLSSIVKMKIAKKENYSDSVDFETQGTELEITPGNQVEIDYTVTEDGIYVIYAKNEAGHALALTKLITKEFPISGTATIDEANKYKINIQATNSMLKITKVKIALASEVTGEDYFQNKGTEIAVEPNKTITTSYTVTEQGTYKVYIEDEMKNSYVISVRVEEENPFQIDIVQNQTNLKSLTVTAKSKLVDIVAMKKMEGNEDLTIEEVKEKGEDVEIEPSKEITKVFEISGNTTFYVYVKDAEGYGYLKAVTFSNIPENPNPDPSTELTQEEIEEYKTADVAKMKRKWIEGLQIQESEVETYCNLLNAKGQGKLHKEGQKIKNEKGEEVTLKGVNLDFAWHSSHVNYQEMFEAMKLWGINCIRIPLALSEENSETIGQIVKEATESGLYCILKVPVSSSETNLEAYSEEVKKYVELVAKDTTIQDYIMYEIASTPYSISINNLITYIKEIEAVIKTYKENPIIICGYGQEGIEAFHAALSENNLSDVMIGGHNYMGYAHIAIGRNYSFSQYKELYEKGIPLVFCEWSYAEDLDTSDNPVEYLQWCHENSILSMASTYSYSGTEALLKDLGEKENVLLGHGVISEEYLTDKGILTFSHYLENTFQKIKEKQAEEEEFKVEVSYSTVEKTTEPVIVTLKSNKILQAMEDWELSENKLNATKEYTQNVEETITMKDVDGNETTVIIKISNIEEPVAEFKKGDPNKDGQVNITDVLIVLRHIAAEKTGTHEEWKQTGSTLRAMDVNEDGKVDTTDVIIILRHIAATKSEQVKEKHPNWITL